MLGDGCCAACFCRSLGLKVDDPAELPGALAQAMKVVREEKRQALVNVVCGVA